MDNSDVISLVKIDVTVDAYGDPIATETVRDVYAEVLSVGQKEFYQAQAVGLQPELKFRICDYADYSGERFVDYEGNRYRVLRTYRNGLAVELTVYREVNQ